MRNKDFELLAPAGNLEIFKGVIESGADAVYVGGSMFGARAYANNFTEEELLEAIDFAHLRGVKVYLTVNTLIKNSEFSKLYDYLLVYYKRGLDAVIVQDIGVVKAIHEYFPSMEIHTSTQMTVTGADGVRFLLCLRVVRPLRRECRHRNHTCRYGQRKCLRIIIFLHIFSSLYLYFLYTQCE